MLDWTLKKRLTICFALFVLPLGSFLFPPGPLLVSEETTVVKGPLDSSGKLAFFAHLNSEFENTPPEENGYHATKDSLVVQHRVGGYEDANRFIHHWWKRLPLGDVFAKADLSEVSQDKIFGSPEMRGKYYELFTKRWGHSWDEHETSRAQLFRTLVRYRYALEYPWKKEDAPVLGHYLDLIDEIWLDKFLEAAQYEKYISPIISDWRGIGGFYGVNEQTLLNTNYRYFPEFFPAQALHLKTTFMVGEGEAVSWLKQLKGIHCLVRMRHNSNKMQADHLNTRGAELTILFLYSKIIRLTEGDEKVLSQIEENLNLLPPARTEAEFVDRILRFYALNFLQEVKEHGFGPYFHYAEVNAKPLSGNFAFAWSILSSLTDWDAQAEHLNRHVDEMVEVLNDSGQMSSEELSREWLQRLMASDMSEVAKVCLVAFWEGNFPSIGWYKNEVVPNFNLLNAQIAMERYRNQHGNYPSSLKHADFNKDVPEDMAEVPFEYANELGYYFSRVEVSTSTAEYLPWSSDGHRSLDRNRPEPYFAGGNYFQFIGSNSFSLKSAALVEELGKRGAVFKGPARSVEGFRPSFIWFNADNGHAMDDSSVSTLADAMLLDHRISYVFFENTSLSADGVISLVEKLSSDENMRPWYVTLMGPQINERVIKRYRELGTSKVRLQVGSQTFTNTVEK